ncbi:uncharacterized protein V1510DRAFT_423165 [Dipodascopsis tothii]|uniref:uncharacterized protein n=1 Tax=Dipodascopsis tothii TaxID=44089 RepID=UPI0034CFBC55
MWAKSPVRTANRAGVTVISTGVRGCRALSSSASRAQINKVVPSADVAVAAVRSGATLLSGGFGLCGLPNTLISALLRRPDVRDITAVSNNAGLAQSGLGKLLASGQVTKMIASYVGENKVFEDLYLSGQIELELTPQGTLAERCRAGGAGVPAFYTPAAVGTVIQSGDLPVRFGPDGSVVKTSEPRESRTFDGREYLLERAIKGDVAFVRAHKADALGNCVFRYTARNFNVVMAKAAAVTIVEAEHVVPVGSIAPDDVHLPGIYVTHVVQATEPTEIERKTEAVAESAPALAGPRERIVRRAAREFRNGMYVNLGIGMPMLAPAFVPAGVEVQLQSENGILGLGPYPQPGTADADVINAGKETVTLLPGAAVFGSDESFAMIRAGKVDMSILGAMQVSMYGDLANWMLPGKVKGMGGAMDLVANPEQTRVVVTMEHVDRKGNPKIVAECAFPVTGRRCVSRIITDYGVFDVDGEHGLTLVEIAPGLDVATVLAATGAPVTVAADLAEM